MTTHTKWLIDFFFRSISSDADLSELDVVDSAEIFLFCSLNGGDSSQIHSILYINET